MGLFRLYSKNEGIITLKCLINAISISEGGGLIVLKKMLEELTEAAPDAKWYVTAKPQTLESIPLSQKIVGLPYSWVDKSPIHHLFWYESILPGLLKRIQADICFSRTNFLPHRKLFCPTLLLVHHAGYFSEKFKQLHFQI